MSSHAKSESSQLADEEALVDSAYIHEFYNGNEDLEQKMVVVFIDTYTDELKDFVDFPDAAETDNTRRQLHTLKSSARYVGAITLSEMCERLEAKLRGGEMLLAEEYLAVEPMLSLVLEQLRRLYPTS